MGTTYSGSCCPVPSWTIYDDMNPDYVLGHDDQPRWEPWEDDLDDDFLDFVGCEFCRNPEAPKVDPFTQKPCCDGCFNEIIGGDRDDRPWRCGNEQE